MSTRTSTSPISTAKFNGLNQSSTLDNGTTLRLFEQFLDFTIISSSLLFLLRARLPYLRIEHFSLAILASLVCVLSMVVWGSYSTSRNRGLLAELKSLFPSWMIMIFSSLLFGYLIKESYSFPRLVMVVWGLTVPVILSINHIIFNIFLGNFADKIIKPSKAVILGAGPVGVQLVQNFIEHPELGIKVKGFFDDNSDINQRELPAPILGKIKDLISYLRNESIDSVYIALSMNHAGLINQIVSQIQNEAAISINWVPDLYAFNLIRSRISEVGGLPVVTLVDTPFKGLNRIWKRATDIVVGSVVLVLVSPILIAAAIAVRLSSPGPIIFEQDRHGENGKIFKIKKFRTMSVCENGDDVKQAQKNDPRVTKVGAFLRKTSIDELPQIFNVLEGTMSLVGPRPQPVKLNEEYKGKVKHFWLRHIPIPGITGKAQISGCRGETPTIEHMQKRVDHDIDYVNKWSWSYDYKIIVKTAIQLTRNLINHKKVEEVY